MIWSVLEAAFSKSEFGDHADYFFGVFLSGANQNIKVACVSRPTVAVRADDDVFNAAGV
jgi:hypothetical protein